MRINIRMTPEQAERFAAYISEHELPESDAARIAIDRLTAKKPTKSEREAAKRKPGNPNFGRKENGQ